MKRSKRRKQIRRLRKQIDALRPALQELQRDLDRRCTPRVTSPTAITGWHVAPVGNGYAAPPGVRWDGPTRVDPATVVPTA